ncbi:MAG: TIR domain-containing protein [Gallionellaceae bacterium]|jgi:hypothetical protein
MDTRPPLHIYLLAHPKSEVANSLAASLMRHFVARPASGGLRVPVYFIPDMGDDLPPALDKERGLNLDVAQHSLVVILADERMVRTVHNGTGNDWIDFVRQALEQTPLNESPHHVLPVALEQEGFHVSDTRHILPAILVATMETSEATNRRLADISFHIASRAIQLLVNGKVPAVAPSRMQAPVSIFLSHAKVDLAADQQDPVRQTRAVLNELPVAIWYDASEIATGQGFADAISAGIRDCSIMLAFQTDHYSASPWCRREVLEAKRFGAHVLIVDALQSGEARSFPYIGNVPTVRWQYSDSGVDARRVVDCAVLEALRFIHNRAILEREAEPDEVVLPSAPEALTLAHECGNADSEKTFLYPDPPLGREELEVLQQLRPRAHFLTPLTKVARLVLPEHISTITVSISESDDLHLYGLSQKHFETLTDEIHLYLLLAGLQIAYGGALKGDFSRASNFTLRLFELVRTYSKLAEGVQAAPIKGAILNIAPWPLWLGYGESEWKLFSGNIARYEQSPRPDLPWGEDDIFPYTESGRVLGSDTPQRRYAWALGLTAMRQLITTSSQARLVLGGKMAGFSGLAPGVVEEAWISLVQQKPLFLVGGFGGAARAVCDLLRGTKREEFTKDWARQYIDDYDTAVGLYSEAGQEFISLETMGLSIAIYAGQDLGQVLNNGLDDRENRELMASTDVHRISGLVLTGLGRL